MSEVLDLMLALRRLTSGLDPTDGYPETRFGVQDDGEDVVSADLDQNPER